MTVPLLLLLAAGTPAAPPVDEAFFETAIRPIFAAHCAGCHDDKKQKGGLRLTTRAELLKGGDTGPAVVPGDAAKSLLVEAVNYSGDLKMPPKGKLPAADIAAITKWVAAGAAWPDAGNRPAAAAAKTFDVAAVAAGHWAFQPVRKLTPPAGPNPVDAFLLEKLAAAGLGFAPPADKRTLLRRVTFDLTGLPPTPAEIQAFLKDDSAEAFAKVVDRLLASPHYGERWGRHWLDLVRYAETQGHEFDFEIPDAWRYRDYVIRAFNENLPYDRFVTEHIAGDLLPAPRRHPVTRANESVVGTGFWFLGEAKHSPVDVRQDQADRFDNMIDVYGKTFLGLTISCARCHDHKFDPIAAKDYYALYGVLSSSRYDRAFLDPPAAGALAEPAPERTPLPGYEAFGPGWRNRWFAAGPAFAGIGDTPPHSGAIAEGLAGSLRSPTFRTESKFVAVRVAGKRAKLRLVLDGLQLIQDPIYGGLSRGVDHGDEFRWILIDVSMWPGHAAYLELLDDGPGAFAVDCVRFCDAPPAGKPTPAPPAARPGEKVPTPPRAVAMADGTAWDERVFVRGSPKAAGEPAPRRFLELFSKAKFDGVGSGRLQLAESTVRGNPLAARVWVNRVWQHHFGVGLVATPDDFGRQGRPPSHPELLDYLADTFTVGGWDTKALHRKLLLTRAYQMSATPTPADAATAATADPQNKLLHRANVRRLQAEAVRDAVLAASGRLNPAAGGPGVAPHLTEHMVGRGRPGGSGPLDGDGRRSVYLQVRRNFVNPLFLAFDYPTPFTTIGRRGETNVPAQALAMLNNPFVAGQADVWGKKVAAAPGTPAERVAGMYETAFARPPSAGERAVAAEFLGEKPTPAGWAEFAHALFNAKEFVFVP